MIHCVKYLCLYPLWSKPQWERQNVICEWVKNENKRPRARYEIWSVLNSLHLICHNICYGKLQSNPFGWQKADMNTLHMLNSPVIHHLLQGQLTVRNRQCIVCVYRQCIMKAFNVFEWLQLFLYYTACHSQKRTGFVRRGRAVPWDGMTHKT